MKKISQDTDIDTDIDSVIEKAPAILENLFLIRQIKVEKDKAPDIPYSENMQHDRLIEAKLRIINPFRPSRIGLLICSCCRSRAMIIPNLETISVEYFRPWP